MQGAKLPKDYQPKKSNMKILSTRLPYPSPDSLLKPTWARDMVRRIEHRPLFSGPVFWELFPSPGVLDLLQLAAITEAVHDLEERTIFRARREVVKARVVEGAVGKYYLGKCGWVPIVAVKFEQIQIIAVEAQRRYDDALAEWDTVYASINRIEQLEEENRKKDEKLRKKYEEKDEELRKKDEELRKKKEELREKDELIRQLLSQA
ncbi:hypothetical protein BJ912DRAFT_1144368 [Pholiota molesta]|nr:hypothetical protein BJ912DRAFT_1144368 [Pholiota molesta]